MRKKDINGPEIFEIRALHIIDLMYEGFERSQIAEILNVPISSISTYIRGYDIEAHSDELRVRGMAVLRYHNRGIPPEGVAGILGVKTELIKLDIRRMKKAGKWYPKF